MNASEIKKIKDILNGTSRKKVTRVHRREMLAYNQALLDHACFPITGAGTTLTRDEVEGIVNKLREELEV